MEAFGLQIPSMSLGSGMWEMTHTTEQLPVSEVAHTASQLESGGSGFSFDINSALKDLAGVWLAKESNENQWANQEQQTAYLRAQNGAVYPAGQYMTPPVQVGGMNVLMLVGVAIAALILLKD